MSDVSGIMKPIDGFVTRGNTVVIIEYNTDVMKQVDYDIGVGLDSDTCGSEAVSTGTPCERLPAHKPLWQGICANF